MPVAPTGRIVPQRDAGVPSMDPATVDALDVFSIGAALMEEEPHL